MKLRLSVLLTLAVLSPLAAYAATQAMPDLDAKLAKHEEFKFYIAAATGELKPADNGHYTLTLSGENVKNVVYKTFAPAHTLKTVPMTQFAQYWSTGKTFNKTSPNAGVVASDKKGGPLNLTYIVNLKNINYSGDDKVSFDCTLMSNPQVTGKVELWKPVMIVDLVGGGGFG